jgi:peroxiredoxin
MEVRTTAAEMTTSQPLRYKFERNGELRMQVNDKAPEFTLPDENGNPVSLKQFRGQSVVLFFFPKADTPG